MLPGKTIIGRAVRRLPLVVVVWLQALDQPGGEEREKTYTDNLSVHGARVMSARLWDLGAQVEVTPLHEESPVKGEVVYCQKLGDAHFSVGLKFTHSPIPWRVLQRFDGI